MVMAPMIVSVLICHSLIAVLETDAGVHILPPAVDCALVSRTSAGLAQLKVRVQHEDGIS
jgi:hypothetical protein